MQRQILNKDYNNLIKCVHLPHFIVNRKQVVGGVYETIYMCAIDEKQEDYLDRKRPICINIKTKGEVIVPSSDVFLYGKVDISSTGEDYKLLEQDKKLINQDMFEGGKWIPSNYIYDTHCSLSDKKYQRISQTWSAAQIIQYGHGCIGKPERVAIFKIVSKQ